MRSGSKLNFSSTYHPQYDGQTKVVNQTIKMCLHCWVGEHPRHWLSLLPWVDYCYNTSFHTTLRATPFQIVYRRPPPCLLSYESGLSKLEAVDTVLQTRDKVLHNARHHLQLAQSRMEQTYNRMHREVVFEPGQWVWIKLQPYHQKSIARRKANKLCPNFYGPFQVQKKIGKVVYQIELPPDSQVHNVFHVSLLNEFKAFPHR